MHVFKYNKPPLLNSTLSVFKKLKNCGFKSSMFPLQFNLVRFKSILGSSYCSVILDQAVEVVLGDTIIKWMSEGVD
jgi:hypothetical protein